MPISRVLSQDVSNVKIPPHNTEAEKSVLGSMLIDDEAIGTAVEFLDQSAFYEEATEDLTSMDSFTCVISYHKT